MKERNQTLYNRFVANTYESPCFSLQNKPHRKFIVFSRSGLDLGVSKAMPFDLAINGLIQLVELLNKLTSIVGNATSYMLVMV